jgi:hypothetical protein
MFSTTYDGKLPSGAVGEVWFELPPHKIDFSQLIKIG